MADILILAGSATVAANLADADSAQGMPHEGGEALTTQAAEHHTDPSVLGLNGTVWVSIAMIFFLAIVIWKGGVRAVTAGLDRGIADIRRQLDEAKALRAEAEKLRDEYAAKIAAAEGDAAEMTRHAGAEAEAIVAQAKIDADALVERRAKMAEEKIAAAERSALAEVRTKTAQAAATAAATLIRQRHGADADRALVDRAIAGIGRPH
ncbi:ATP synthase subunit B [Sphingomonas sp. Leaf412]|nr:ATP synthase subunit B [Sphingomonas sp. Leaf412]KQT32546.1 ATP synthase subunit B [Sphingomonas sp. Leaf412]